MDKPPTLEDFKKINEMLVNNKAKNIPKPLFCIIDAADLKELIGGNFEINPGTHIEKKECNIFVT